MSGGIAESVVIQVDARQTVSGLLTAPSKAKACLVLAHGAGAGMNHPFMAAVAEGLAGREIATLRFHNSPSCSKAPSARTGLRSPMPLLVRLSRRR